MGKSDILSRVSWLPVVASGVGAWLLYKLLARSSDAPEPLAPQPPEPPGPSLPAVPSGGSVILIGDSLGVGLGAPLKALAEADGVTLAGWAESSTRIPHWRKYLAAIHPLPSPDLWLVSLGTNDCLLPDPTVERADLIALLELLGPRALWLAPAPSPATPKLDAVLDMVREVGGVVLPPPPDGYARGKDQIHATGAGYAAWAKYVWQHITGSQ